MASSMSGELRGTLEKRHVPLWMARVMGAVCVSSIALVAAAEPVAPATTTYSMEVEAPPPTVPIRVELPPSIQPVDMNLTIQQRTTRDTGMDMLPCRRDKICGTDLLVPVELLPDANGVVSQEFFSGDSFQVMGPYVQDLPPGGDMWRSPIGLISSDNPEVGKPINFQSAANRDGNGVAQEVMFNHHRGGDGREITIFPNDGIAIPETGEIIMSYQSVNGEITPKHANWSTGYAGLAISHDNGQHFDRMLMGPDQTPNEGDPVWMNNPDNSDPFQMWSMDRDGDFVYIITTRAGRQMGPMMMLRVPVTHIKEKGYYECWNGKPGDDGFGGDCQPLLPDSMYGEPSLKKIDDGTPEGIWVMSYVDYTHTELVSRYSKKPWGPWSEPLVQASFLDDLNGIYGGFESKKGSTPEHMVWIVSRWVRKIDPEKYGKYGELEQYGVSHLVGNIYKNYWNKNR